MIAININGTRVRKLMPVPCDASGAWSAQSGVYLLFLRGKLRYIGKSKHVYRRVAAHKTRGVINFDAAYWFEATGDERDEAEKALISKFRPHYNKRQCKEYNPTLAKKALAGVCEGDFLMTQEDAAQKIIAGDLFPYREMGNCGNRRQLMAPGNK